MALVSASRMSDRAPERRPITGSLHKPPVLSRAQLSVLCVLALFVILYGTLGPVTAANQPWIAPGAAWSWRVPVDATDYNDVVTNIAVFIPVGIAMRLLVRRRGMAGWPDFIVGFSAALALSYTVELLQQFMPLRSSNLLDVLTNAIGALIGCMAAVAAQTQLRRLHAAAFECLHLKRDAWALIMWAAVAAALVVMTMPWTLKRPVLTWGIGEPLSYADPHATGRFIMFAAVGLLGAGRALLLGLSPRRSLYGTIWRIALFAEVVELAQAALGEHVSSQLHVIIASLGGMAGATIAVCASDDDLTLGNTGERATRKRLRLLALLALVLVLALSLMSDIGASSGAVQLRPAAEFRWMPFRSHFHVSFTTALADITQLFMKYAVLALVGMAFARGRSPAGALLLVIAVAVLIETARAFLIGRPGDSTSLIVALVAWACVARAWSALYPAPRPAAAG